MVKLISSVLTYLFHYIASEFFDKKYATRKLKKNSTSYSQILLSGDTLVRQREAAFSSFSSPEHKAEGNLRCQDMPRIKRTNSWMKKNY